MSLTREYILHQIYLALFTSGSLTVLTWATFISFGWVPYAVWQEMIPYYGGSVLWLGFGLLMLSLPDYFHHFSHTK